MLTIKGELEMAKFDIDVQLTGKSGNAFAVMSAVIEAMKKAEVSADDIEQYKKESMSGDYNNLLVTAMEWVNVE